MDATGSAEPDFELGSESETGIKIVIKERRCLMCGDDFLSQHAGERICRGCKGTAAWRSGGQAA